MPQQREYKTVVVCEYSNCKDSAYSRGYCRKHYKKVVKALKDAGEFQSIAKGRTCSVEGCDKPHIARDYCSMHYSRWQRGSDMDASPNMNPPEPVSDRPRSKRVKAGHECSTNRCAFPAIYEGLCSTHHMQKRNQRLANLRQERRCSNGC